MRRPYLGLTVVPKGIGRTPGYRPGGSPGLPFPLVGVSQAGRAGLGRSRCEAFHVGLLMHGVYLLPLVSALFIGFTSATSDGNAAEIEGALQYPPPSVGEDAQPPPPARMVPQTVSPRRTEFGASGSSLPPRNQPFLLHPPCEAPGPSCRQAAQTHASPSFENRGAASAMPTAWPPAI